MTLDDTRRRELADGLAARLTRLGLATPAAFFLEWNRPLSFVGGQLLLLAEPFLSPFVDSSLTREYAALFDDREGVDLVVERLSQSRPTATDES